MPNNDPKVAFTLFATGDTPYVDPMQTQGMFPILARRSPHGDYNVATGMFWGRTISYSEMSMGSEFVIPMHHALQSERMLIGDGKATLASETNQLMSGKTGSIPTFDEIGRTSAANLQRYYALGRMFQQELLAIFNDSKLPRNHVMDIKLVDIEQLVLKLRLAWNSMQKGSLAISSFCLAPIGAQVGDKVPAMFSEMPTSGMKKAQWTMAEDPLMMNKDALVSMCVPWFFTLGALGVKKIQEEWAEYLSIQLSILLEKFARMGKGLSTQTLMESAMMLMPNMMRPGLLDLSYTERAKSLTYAAGLLLGVETMQAKGVSSWIGPTVHRSQPTKHVPPIETMREIFHGDVRLESSTSGTPVTLLKPGHGQVTGLALMVGQAKTNRLSPWSWIRPMTVNWTPHVMNSDVLALPESASSEIYTALGFSNRGEVIHMYADITSPEDDLIRIIDQTLRSDIAGRDNSFGVSALDNISTLMFGGTPLWGAETGILFPRINLGKHHLTGFVIDRRNMTIVSEQEAMAANARWESGLQGETTPEVKEE
jgi:hypothetical protein